MNKEMTKQAKADEEILSFDVPDAVLERAGAPNRPSPCFTVLISRPSAVCGISVLAQHFWQLRNIRRNPPRLVNLLGAVTMFCLITLSGSNFAQAASCAEKCAAGCGGRALPA